MSCGSLSAVTTNVISTCYTSVLTIPAVQALDGTTVMCADGISGAVVGSGTVNLRMAASPGTVRDMTVTSTAVDQLTVTWTPLTTGGVPTSYNVTINDSSSPVVIADNGSSVYTHTFTGMVSDTPYTVSVVAINCAGASNAVQHHRRTLAGPPEFIQTISMLKPNNILCHFEVSWIPVRGSVTKYNVNVENDGHIIGHGSTSCVTSPCVSVQQVSAPASSYMYNISVASINGDGSIGPANSTIINGTVENFIDASVSYHGPSNAVIDCTFLNNQSLYCVVCCSTDTSVPPDSSVYNISTTRGTEVTVSLQGLTSGQMYYCTAAGTDANSSSCGGLVVGGVKAYFNISAGLDKRPDSVLFSGSGLQSYIIIIISISVITTIILVMFSIVITTVIRRKGKKNKLDRIHRISYGQGKDGIMPEEPTSAAILVSSCSVDLRQKRSMEHDHTCDPGGYAKCTGNMEHHRTCDSGGYEKCARNMEHHRTCDSGGYEKCARNMEHHHTRDPEGYEKCARNMVHHHTRDPGGYETCYPERGYEYVHVDLARRAVCISLSAEKTSPTENVSHVNPFDEISTCVAKREESANTYIYSTPDVTKKVMHSNTPLGGKSPIYILLGPEGTPCKKPVTSAGCTCRPEETDALTIQTSFLGPNTNIHPPVFPDGDDQYTASRKGTNEHLKCECSSESKEAHQLPIQTIYSSQQEET
eukprot:Em0006g572a